MFSRQAVACTLLVALLCVFAAPAVAQGDPPAAEGWEVVQRCVELQYPVIPQNRWDFEGVIFSRNDEGVRAIRTDVSTSYFVALASDTSYALVGGFSPDGRWFAYPLGSVNYNVNIVGDNTYTVNEIMVVSTDPARTVYRLSWENVASWGLTPEWALPYLHWIDNTRFVYEAQGMIDGGMAMAYPFAGEIEPWMKSVSLSELFVFSPDFTRAVYVDLYPGESSPVRVYDVENDTLLEIYGYGLLGWLPDSSGFAGQRPGTPDLLIYDRDGRPSEEVIATTGDYSRGGFSPDGRRLAFISGNRLFYAEMGEQIVVDLCLEIQGQPNILYPGLFPEPSLPWSPDGTTLAFTYDDYPILLNVETLDMQILDYPTGEILGWYPLE